jgi:hypothetical protein
MFRQGIAVGSVLSFILVLVAFSQERRGPGFAGRGGFGPGPGINNAMLLGMPEVQKELGLDDAKQKEVGEWVGKTRSSFVRRFRVSTFRSFRH